MLPRAIQTYGSLLLVCMFQIIVGNQGLSQAQLALEQLPQLETQERQIDSILIQQQENITFLQIQNGLKYQQVESLAQGLVEETHLM